MRWLAAVIVIAACMHAAHPTEPMRPGIAIAVYGGASAYAVVDERRWLALDTGELSLDHITPGAELASLWVSALDDPHIVIDRCTRPTLALPESTVDSQHVWRLDVPTAYTGGPTVELAPPLATGPALRPSTPPPIERAEVVEVSPAVRCRVVGAHGRHLVRVVYVTTGLDVHTEHAIAMTDPDHAHVTSRFAVATPRWNERAELVVFAAASADPEHSQPRELARGQVTLDGSTAVIATPPREVAAHLRRIYSGAVPSPGVEATTASWHAESTRAVWVWLELGLGELAAGDMRVHVELAGESERDVDVTHAVSVDPAQLRIPLWTDPELSGARERVTGSTGDSQLVEQLDLSVANVGATSREVWIEEEARPGPHRRLTGARPAPPQIHGDLLRSIVEIGPRAIAHVRYTIRYDDTSADCHVDCSWSAGHRVCERRC